MTEFLYFALLIFIFAETLIIHRDSRLHIKQGNAIIKSMNAYIKKERRRK